MNNNQKLVFVCGVLALVVAGGCFAQQAEPVKPPKPLPLLSLSQEEALQFWVWLANQAVNFNPGSEDFKNIPQPTVNRLKWMVNKQSDGLSYNLQSGRLPQDEMSILMISSYKGSNPIMDVNLSLLAAMFWKQYQSKTLIDRKSRNTLILGFSHEVIHLKHGPLVMHATQSDMQLREFEERRTWAQSIMEDIRPMVEKGEPVLDDFTQANEILRSCNDDFDCPAFKKFISIRTGKGK